MGRGESARAPGSGGIGRAQKERRVGPSLSCVNNHLPQLLANSPSDDGRSGGCWQHRQPGEQVQSRRLRQPPGGGLPNWPSEPRREQPATRTRHRGIRHSWSSHDGRELRRNRRWPARRRAPRQESGTSFRSTLSGNSLPCASLRGNVSREAAQMGECRGRTGYVKVTDFASRIKCEVCVVFSVCYNHPKTG
jgi:hypothetical protein